MYHAAMRLVRVPILIPILLLTFASASAQPAVHRAKVRAIPDFLQTDPEAGFAKSGSQFCAPTAVSNSFMWLADNGYDDLRPSGSGKKAQIAMIRTLSGAKYMKTNPKIGTDVAQVLEGIAGYVDEAGYAVAELSYSGWRPAPEDYVAGELPDLDAIRAAVADDSSAAWLNVGWYRYDEDSGNYARNGGHWVTVVGYTEDELLIHDPSPSAGTGFRTHAITLDELTEGRLTGNQRNLPRSAEGYYEVGGEMAVPPGWTCILDGAVVLTLE
jgi:hypothetical protein